MRDCIPSSGKRFGEIGVPSWLNNNSLLVEGKSDAVVVPGAFDNYNSPTVSRLPTIVYQKKQSSP